MNLWQLLTATTLLLVAACSASMLDVVSAAAVTAQNEREPLGGQPFDKTWQPGEIEQQG